MVDRDDRHVYQPGLLFVPFGLTSVDDIVRSRRAQLRDGILFRRSEVDHVDLDADVVNLANGKAVPFDVLVVATGSRLLPEETAGMTGPGWMSKVFTFYTPEGENFYTVPGADVKSAQLDLVIATGDQTVAEAGVDAPEGADELFVVNSPAKEGIAIIRAPLSGSSRAALM